MDPITQISNKLNAELARSAQQYQPPPPEASPPPYTASDSDSDSDSDSEDQEAEASSLKLTINAAHSIRGSNNLVPTSPAPLADATKFGTLLLHSINQINNAQAACEGRGGRRRRLRVDLTINCGITVFGDRNVIGNVGLKPKGAGSVGEREIPLNAVVGAKRKAEDVHGDEPEAKKAAVEGSSP